MRALDTPPEIEKMQIEILRKISPEKRLKMAIKLTESAIRLLMEGVKTRHPEYNEKEAKLAVIRIILGDELFEKVYEFERVYEY